MESLQNSIKPFPCTFHPSEEIQRVCLDPDSEHSLQCIECILQTKHNLPKDKFCPLADFVNYAAEQYKTVERTRSCHKALPKNLVDFLAYEEIKTEALVEHIEREKQKIQENFNSLLEEFTLLCHKKKEEISTKLDLQLIFLKNNYAIYKNKIDKYENNHSQKLDINSLTEKINQCKDTQEMEIFVKNLKEDIILPSAHDPQSHLEDLKDFSQELKKQSNKVPRADFPQSLIEEVKKLFQDFSEIQDPIHEMSVRNLSFDSKIVTKARDATLIKKWLRSSTNNAQLHLLYRGSRDGIDANTFHQKCDDYLETLTVIKSKSGTIFGGYSDQSWRELQKYKKSNNCWLFSIDHQEKYPVRKNSTKAIYTYPGYGPTFGGGHDLHLNLSNGLCYSDLGHSYEYDNENLNERQSRLAGEYRFEIEDIEIFAVQSLDLLDSLILNPSIDLQLIQSWITKLQKMELELIYRGSRDGFDAKAFHTFCDDQGPTLVVCKSAETRKVFGGFTSQNWSKSNQYVADKSAFLFSLSCNTKHFIKDSSHAIFCNEQTGPIFGRGYDLFIAGGDTECNCALGTTYNCVEKIHNSREYLAGEANFTLEEIEVFKVLINFDFKCVENKKMT